MTTQKRVLDLVGALVGLVLLAPLFVVIALLVKLQDGGPVFFRQVRVGREGRRFQLWKFRTMTCGMPQNGLELTVGDDPRVTLVGAWLRRLKLDEIPQLLNILTGEMSLVRPRPEVPRYVACYDPAQRRVLGLTPGLTDEASLRFRDESTLLASVPDPAGFYLGTVLPEKIDLSLAYACRATVWSDIGMIILTIWRVFGSRSPDASLLRALGADSRAPLTS